MVLMLPLILALTDPPIVTVDRDNVEITQSCIVQIDADHIIDADGNGVIQITANNIRVDLQGGRLHGAMADQLPDSFAGIGVMITGRNVTLRNAKVSGYKVGIRAIDADGLTIRDCDVSNNFHQRLKSTPAAEDASDWLWPHANDNDEWITNYGAGIAVKNSKGVTLRDIRARKTQNGIILDRVNDSRVYDNDCSFLSGWGLAMWRSNRNVISRNAFDFCVRGYSHGVYNRGQDSAGILMFEQCNENWIVENSVTHGGDGIFAFAGKEALGEVNPRADAEWYESRGCNHNRIFKNDLSYAAAHGLEVTFSFNNIAMMNRFAYNAICGVWAGYSQRSMFADNDFEGNGDCGYGLERGGVNIEHGSLNGIANNRFADNACGVHLWWDDDAHIFALPWYRMNEPGLTTAVIGNNVFNRDEIAVHLRNLNLPVAVVANDFGDAKRHVEATDDVVIVNPAPGEELRPQALDTEGWTDEIRVFGEKQAVGNRRHLRGRENIIMTEWGPWDHESPLLRFERRVDHADEYRLFNAKVPPAEAIAIEGEVGIDVVPDENLIIVHPVHPDALRPYTISLDVDGERLSASGTLSGGTWEVQAFASPCDPREDVDRWRREGRANAHTLTADALDFRFGSRGMSELRGLVVELPRDHFGVIATRTLTIPNGTWRIKTTSDDGIRVWMNGDLVIDDWTWHAPKQHTHEFHVNGERPIEFRVEYFELDGHAVLAVEFERAD